MDLILARRERLLPRQLEKYFTLYVPIILQSNPFLSDEEEDGEKDEEEGTIKSDEDLNPFSKDLDKVLEEERRVLEDLKDPLKVPAIVCDNREQIRKKWILNMMEWKEGQEELAALHDEIEMKKEENKTLQEQIEKAQERLQESQLYVQERCR